MHKGAYKKDGIPSFFLQGARASPQQIALARQRRENPLIHSRMGQAPASRPGDDVMHQNGAQARFLCLFRYFGGGADGSFHSARECPCAMEPLCKKHLLGYRRGPVAGSLWRCGNRGRERPVINPKDKGITQGRSPS